VLNTPWLSIIINYIGNNFFFRVRYFQYYKDHLNRKTYFFYYNVFVVLFLVIILVCSFHAYKTYIKVKGVSCFYALYKSLPLFYERGFSALITPTHYIFNAFVFLLLLETICSLILAFCEFDFYGGAKDDFKKSLKKTSFISLLLFFYVCFILLIFTLVILIPYYLGQTWMLDHLQESIRISEELPACTQIPGLDLRFSMETADSMKNKDMFQTFINTKKQQINMRTNMSVICSSIKSQNIYNLVTDFDVLWVYCQCKCETAMRSGGLGHDYIAAYKWLNILQDFDSFAKNKFIIIQSCPTITDFPSVFEDDLKSFLANEYKKIHQLTNTNEFSLRAKVNLKKNEFYTGFDICKSYRPVIKDFLFLKLK